MITTEKKKAAVSESHNLEAQYQNINKFWTQEGDKRMNEIQKTGLRKLLHHYQNKPINKQQFRILQGVLTSDFSLMETKRKAKQVKKSEIKKLRCDVDELSSRAMNETTKILKGNLFELASSYSGKVNQYATLLQEPKINYSLTRSSNLVGRRNSILDSIKEDSSSLTESEFSDSSSPDRNSELSSSILKNQTSQSPEVDDNHRDKISLELEARLPQISSLAQQEVKPIFEIMDDNIDDGYDKKQAAPSPRD